MHAIRRYLYSEIIDANQNPLTAEFNYRWKLIKDGQLLHEPELRETTKRRIVRYIYVDGQATDWVLGPMGSIKKSKLTFTTKFWRLIVRHYLSPIAADKIVTWMRATLMAAMIAGFEVDLTWFLRVVMHERDFKVITT